MPTKNNAAAPAAPAAVEPSTDPAAVVELNDSEVTPAPAAEVDSDFRVLALVPIRDEEGNETGEYSARIFLNRTDVKKNLKLDSLPAGILFYRGKKLTPKTQTVVTL